VLETFGIPLDLTRAGGAAIDEAGIGFIFAPAFHRDGEGDAVRAELGVRTAFNSSALTEPARRASARRRGQS